MKFQGIEYKTEEFNLKRFKKDMADFNKRFPPIKSMMYDLDGKLELIPGGVGGRAQAGN